MVNIKDFCPKCGKQTLRYAKGNENVKSYFHCVNVDCFYMKDADNG